MFFECILKNAVIDAQRGLLSRVYKLLLISNQVGDKVWLKWGKKFK